LERVEFDINDNTLDFIVDIDRWYITKKQHEHLEAELVNIVNTTIAQETQSKVQHSQIWHDIIRLNLKFLNVN
jgi:hypothetical protein